MTDVQKIAFDTLKAGAPGLSDQTRETLAGIIARKVALSTTPVRAEALSEDDARRRLIQRIEQWDGETEYDAEDIAALADDILHEFNGAPVLSSSALGYVSADAEAALKAGINRVIYSAPSAHASFPLYASPVPAQDDDKLRIAVEALEPFSDAYQAYVAVYSELGEFAPSAATEAEKRFWEGEREDTAKEAAFDALSKINFDQLHAVNEALAALKSTAAPK